jgi:hypothetical protein
VGLSYTIDETNNHGKNVISSLQHPKIKKVVHVTHDAKKCTTYFFICFPHSISLFKNVVIKKEIEHANVDVN